MQETLSKAELIYMLKKKEMRETELLMISSLVESLYKKPSDAALKDIILKKIDKKIKDSSVDQPPDYLSCPISFVRNTEQFLTFSGHFLEPCDNF